MRTDQEVRRGKAVGEERPDERGNDTHLLLKHAKQKREGQRNRAADQDGKSFQATIS